MYTSFFTAARGAIEEQQRMNVIANNLANANNYGYKPKTAVFSDLMYYNLNNIYGQETPLKAGTGIVVEKTDTNFEASGYMPTDGKFDYAINGEGFFMLRNPQTNAITYSRNGRFSMASFGTEFYLVNDNGNLVLDENRNPILVTENGERLSGQIGIYDFDILDGMLSTGNNEFSPVGKNGAPYLVGADRLVDHTLEMSGVSVADDFSRVIESQRAYAYARRMVTTSDEVVSTINALRQ